jgi:hypothetical protein
MTARPLPTFRPQRIGYKLFIGVAGSKVVEVFQRLNVATLSPKHLNIRNLNHAPPRVHHLAAISIIAAVTACT